MLECTWPNQCTKNISQNLFGVIHLVRTYLTVNLSTLLSMHAPAYILDVPPAFPQLHTYLMDALFLYQKIHNNIRISCSLKKTLEKTNNFFKSHTHPEIFLHLISVTLSQINGLIKAQFKSYLS